jgi:hypothetical protein
MSFKAELDADIEAESRRPGSDSWVMTTHKADGRIVIESENGVVSDFLMTEEEERLPDDSRKEKFLYGTMEEVKRRKKDKKDKA